MTRLDPAIVLRRLKVVGDGRPVFDQSFRRGLNVLAGENGSGKTTIADFIFFVLGGEPRSWREAALRCDFVFAEVELNGDILTIRREVSVERQRPLSIYWGGLAAADSADSSEWELYPLATRGTKSSFSQVLFRLLGIPEVQTDGQSRITMHQMLRLLYVDQTTAFNEVFVHEDFDSYQIREAVGDLLFGVYDQRIYDAKLQLRELTTRAEVLKQQLELLSRILGPGDEVLVPEYIEQQLANLRAQRDALYSELERSTEGTPPNPLADPSKTNCNRQPYESFPKSGSREPRLTTRFTKRSWT